MLENSTSQIPQLVFQYNKAIFLYKAFIFTVTQMCFNKYLLMKTFSCLSCQYPGNLFQLTTRIVRRSST